MARSWPVLWIPAARRAGRSGKSPAPEHPGCRLPARQATSFGTATKRTLRRRPSDRLIANSNRLPGRPSQAFYCYKQWKRLRHAGRVFVAGADDPKVPEHVGYISTPTVEDAIEQAEKIHGRDCSIVCVEQNAG